MVIRLKMCYTIRVVLWPALCKAICKADRNPESMLAGIFPVRPDRKGVLFYQAFYVWWGFSIVKAQEIAAGFVRNGIMPLRLITTCLVMMEQKLYTRSRAHSSISMYSRFLE